MSHELVRRRARRAGPTVEERQEQLQEPPVLPDPAPRDLGSMVMFLPMLLGVGSMALIYGAVGGGGARGGGSYLFIIAGAMGLSMVAMTLSQLGRSGSDRKRKMNAERRDYLRYIAQLRARARESAEQQRASVVWNNPDPAGLWSMAHENRLWERRAGQDDFGRIRIGLGSRRAALVFLPPESKPIEDLEPLTTISLRRFGEAFRTVRGTPVAVGLRSFTSVELVGEAEEAAALARAMVAQLAVFHAPDELRIAVLTDAANQADWDWVKWLPHAAHPVVNDATGPVPMVATDHDDLLALLATLIVDRGEHETSAAPSADEPFLVVLAHAAAIPESSPLRGQGLRNVVLLDVEGQQPGGERVLRLTCRGGDVEYPSGDVVGTAVADRMTPLEAEVFARQVAPKRTGGVIEMVERPFETDFGLHTLLGIRDLHHYDVAQPWRERVPQRARLKVPIGVDEEGEVVDLDLKESAQGGMGPHGMLIGATGSGKSELLRTLVCSLAATHSSEVLNLVLVDFKGGATFLGMERLPHTSAMITNLSDELPLVDRMQDSLNGELTRRQELLRERGYASLFDYEKARGAGAPLPPLPTLLVIVDEFSELLASKPEFMELFVSIGRLGRSLGVHLLLASQRVDEGRISRVEGHLSYRIALKTFSSIESRSVIGVSDAYQLPSAPGNGYLKVDGELLRFRGAYVSGPCPVPAAAPSLDLDGVVMSDVIPFHTHSHPSLYASSGTEDGVGAPGGGERDGGAPDRVDESGATVVDVLQERLEGAGPAARQVWLPPLVASPTLDSLLPGLVPDPDLGLTIADASSRAKLRIPVGLVDRPYEQTRDVLLINLAGADGHVGVIGAPQTGKSTLLRTIVLGLALTHTPEEVQVYGLDFGGGLASVGALPHVGSLAGRLDRDRVNRTIAEVIGVLERREALFAERGIETIEAFRQARRAGRVQDAHGDVFLVVDGWFTLRQDYPDLEPRLMEIAARGLSFGVHLVIGSSRWSDVRPWLKDVLGTRLELRLGDPMESEVRGRKAATVPAVPGRGLTTSGLHFLAALPRVDGSSGVDDLSEVTRAACDEVRAFWSGPAAQPVRMLPVRLPANELPAPGGDMRLCIGVDEQRLQPVWHDFETTPHLLVMGDEGTGKTNVLRHVLQSITARYGSNEAKVLLADSQRDLDGAVPPEYLVGSTVSGHGLNELAQSAAITLTTRVPGPDISSERLKRRDWWTGVRLFVVVDDHELFSLSNAPSPLEALLPLLAQGSHIGLHLVVARSSANGMRAMMDPVLRRLWELGTPALLFSYPKEEGKFLGEAVPRALPAGRAQLVTRRGVRLVQTACTVDPLALVEAEGPLLLG